jgi:hypothetical protein
VTRPTTDEIFRAIEEASALTHKHRAMRVTLECGHLRLMPMINCVMGIGAFTGCTICPPDKDGHTVARMVVNVEETGHLHDSWVTWFTETHTDRPMEEAP